jgi:uncharacterized membrane protein YedE/YeeE
MTVLSGVGLLDMSTLQIPPTFLGPQIVGGLLLGVGFIVSGYCPGTSWVSMASGNWDGLATILGVIAGSLGFGLAYPLVGDFYLSGSMGVVRLPQLLGVPQAILAAGVVAMAIGAFLFAEWVETTLARRRNEAPPAASAATRNKVFAGLGIATVLGLASMALPAVTVPEAPVKSVAAWDALALAKALVERPGAVQVVDLRAPETCAEKRIPGAMCRQAGDADAAFLSDLAATRTLVLYGDSDIKDLPAGARRFGGEIALLTGGFSAFETGILAIPALAVGATAEALADWRLRSALGAWFSGTKVQAPPPVVRPATPVPSDAPVRKGGGC